MNDRFSSQPELLSIAAVERDTGLSKDTLRVWERRYGFPVPARDAFGERAYPVEQLEKLRLIKRLMAGGHRPGKIVGLSIAELTARAEAGGASVKGTGGAGAAAPGGEIGEFVALLRTHQIEALRQAMSTTLMRIGLENFVTGIAAPMGAEIGNAWARGELEIFEEHLYTETISQLLRSAINSLPRGHMGQAQDKGRPRILLTTFPQEPHALGLLMAEALFALNGCSCVSLGTRTPLADIAMAAPAQRADVVALSFSPCMNARQVIDGLTELRGKLGAEIEIWAGGSSAALKRRVLREVRVLRQLGQIAGEVSAWRMRHGIG